MSQIVNTVKGRRLPDGMPIREHFQTTRGLAAARIAGERSPENAGQINAVVISPRER